MNLSKDQDKCKRDIDGHCDCDDCMIKKGYTNLCSKCGDKIPEWEFKDGYCADCSSRCFT